MRVTNLLACTIALSLAAASFSASAARVCMVQDFDTSGCKQGDDLLYMPMRWGNEQLPVEFAGKKCDLSKPVMWTKGGVACTYAGDKRYVNGYQAKQEMLFGPLYDKVTKNPQGWMKTDNGPYWRIKKQGDGKPVAVGDSVALSYLHMTFNSAGEEVGETADFKPGDGIDALTEKHYVYIVKPNYGAVIEIVGPDFHEFLKVDPGKKKAAAKPKAKPKQ